MNDQQVDQLAEQQPIIAHLASGETLIGTRNDVLTPQEKKDGAAFCLLKPCVFISTIDPQTRVQTYVLRPWLIFGRPVFTVMKTGVVGIAEPTPMIIEHYYYVLENTKVMTKDATDFELYDPEQQEQFDSTQQQKKKSVH